jgi:uncharacterized protein YndB with AHSA1/START domain
MQANHEWNKFVLRIPVDADKQTIFNAWVSPAGLESWFLRKAAFKNKNGNAVNENEMVNVGDSYHWLWHGWPDDMKENGSVFETNGKDRLKFSFGKAGNVTVTIKEEAGENIVELVQDEIPTDDASVVYYHLGCMKGWLFYLVNLKSMLEGGIDLRNRKLELKEVVNS